MSKLTVSVEYCAQWHYTDRAVSLTAEMLKEFEHQIAEWKLIPSGGGVFEVVVNGELVFSKKQLGRHAEVKEIRELIRARL